MIQREFRLSLTPFCNYGCFFCHREGVKDNNRNFKLTPEDYLFLIQVAKQAWGWETVTLTGGEPLISPIYYRVCELLATAGIRITTVTNASLFAKPERLSYNSQLNISLHTMNPQTYARITRQQYSLENILQSIHEVRSKLPEIDIHINATIIRGYNHRIEDLKELIDFAKAISATPKFVDLASQNPSQVVSIAEIVEKLQSLEFQVETDTPWQVKLRRLSDSLEAIVTRCGFSSTHQQLELRNLFAYPDGTISSGQQQDMPIHALSEIKTRDARGLIEKVISRFPMIQN